jgi:hypothetical protein
MVLDPLFSQIEKHLIMPITVGTEVYYLAPGQELFEVVGESLVIADLLSEREGITKGQNTEGTRRLFIRIF